MEVHNLSLTLEPRDEPAVAAAATNVLPLLRCAKLQVCFCTSRLQPLLVTLHSHLSMGSRTVAGHRYHWTLGPCLPIKP